MWQKLPWWNVNTLSNEIKGHEGYIKKENLQNKSNISLK